LLQGEPFLSFAIRDCAAKAILSGQRRGQTRELGIRILDEVAFLEICTPKRPAFSEMV